MGRRCVFIISILLFCLLSGGCSSRGVGVNLLHEDAVTQEGYRVQAVSEEESTSNQEGSTAKQEGSTAYQEETTRNQEESTASQEESTRNQEAGLSDKGIETELYHEEETRLQRAEKEIEADTLTAYKDPGGLVKFLREYPASTGIKLSEAMKERIDWFFYMEELSEETKNRIHGKSYGDNCDVPYEELRYIRVLYYDFDGRTRIGELIVNKAIAQDILDIFRELYEIQYPIERMVLIDEYDADDERSMSDNNSSAFNYRCIAGTTRLSKHSLGFAIDINPLYNPYITTIEGEKAILPENGSEYADRTKDCPYYIREGDACYEAFISRGFTWGGDWQNSKDYQHFQKVVD